jgi:hypothetical protein
MKKQAQLAALFLAAATAAMAQESGTRLLRANGEWIEEIKGTLPAGKIVKVKTTMGSIQLTGTSQDSISYTFRKHVRAASEEAARLKFANMRITAVNQGDISLLRAEGGNRDSIGVELNVPARVSFVRLETGGGFVSASNIAGGIEAVTGGGPIRLDEIGAGAFASSGGGSIEIGKVAGDMRAETGGGGIRIGSVGGQVVASSGGGTVIVGGGKAMTLQTGGGSISVGKCDGKIKALTGGGSIDLTDVDGPVQVESGGGSIRVGAVRSGLRVNTGSGPIRVDLSKGIGAFTDSRLETATGDIVVYIPDDLGVRVRAAVESAREFGIRSDFPGIKIIDGERKWGPHEAYAEGDVNGGGPLLKVHTTSGTIEIKRKK